MKNIDKRIKLKKILPKSKRKESQPPFLIGNFVSLAYMSGFYTPGAKVGPRGFLGLYTTKAKRYPKFCFMIFDYNGERLAYMAVSPENSNLEYALIWGLLQYAVPLEQWRPYRIDEQERKTLRKMKILNEYEDIRCSLGNVLYQARVFTYFSFAEWKSMFAIRPRSLTAIRKDLYEREEIMRLVGLRSAVQGGQKG
jgi:hypothetical protein